MVLVGWLVFCFKSTLSFLLQDTQTVKNRRSCLVQHILPKVTQEPETEFVSQVLEHEAQKGPRLQVAQEGAEGCVHTGENPAPSSSPSQGNGSSPHAFFEYSVLCFLTSPYKILSRSCHYTCGGDGKSNLNHLTLH